MMKQVGYGSPEMVRKAYQGRALRKYKSELTAMNIKLLHFFEAKLKSDDDNEIEVFKALFGSGPLDFKITGYFMIFWMQMDQDKSGDEKKIEYNLGEISNQHIGFFLKHYPQYQFILVI